MIITIQEEYLLDGSRQYSIVGGSNCSFASFKWWLIPSGTTNPAYKGSNNVYINTTPIYGDKVYVEVNNFSETYWNGGEFYGGNFYGNFGGGTFHYGQLNDCFYLKQEIKPRPFIEDINKPTGPQSVKPVNTSRLL